MRYTIGTKVFGDWEIKKELGAGAYGVVYEIEKNHYGVCSKSALKVIRIPASKSEVKSALSEGMDEVSVTHYFEGCVKEIVKEIAVMSSLKNHPNIVTYEDHHVERDTEEFGWYILMRMELLTSLRDYQFNHNMTESDIIRMAKDICNALSYCQQKQIIHRDIKPENIFVNELGEFKLGDFGVARTVDKTMSGLSKKGTESYMAPEVYLGKPYGASVDIYSLGILMYRMLNDNRMPFLPRAPKPITFQDRENAMVRRMRGEELPIPISGSDHIKSIVLKACAYNPMYRYHTPENMLMDLNQYGQTAQVQKKEKVQSKKKISITSDRKSRDEGEHAKTLGLWDNLSEVKSEKTEEKRIRQKKEDSVKNDIIVEEKKEGIWTRLKKFTLGRTDNSFNPNKSTMNTEFENMKYNYILNNYNNQDMQTYQYLVELKEQGYRDAGTLYENLYQWRAILTANMLRDDYMTDENYFKVGDIFYFHVILEGGYPGEEITLKAIVSDSEKTSEWKFYNNLIWKNGFYDTLWGMQCEGSDVGEPVTVKIMNGNYVIGEKTIYTMP